LCQALVRSTCQPLFDNAKKLRALLGELQDLTLEIIDPDTRQPGQEPETQGPEIVGRARLTSAQVCGQPSAQVSFALVNPKHEDLTRNDLEFHYPRPWPTLS
jgi:hypothetical protein